MAPRLSNGTVLTGKLVRQLQRPFKRIQKTTNDRKVTINKHTTVVLLANWKISESPSILNNRPSQRLDVYVFGTNSNGELGLGDAIKKSEVVGPTLNPKLSAKTIGVVQIAIGGVHSAALTYDNQILTWGVNDEGALGRDTNENIQMTSIDATSDSDEDEDEDDEEDDEEEDDEVDLNLKEASPLPVDPSHFPAGTVFTQLVATDSATFVLTEEGLVYGWGTFIVSDFSKKKFKFN